MQKILIMYLTYFQIAEQTAGAKFENEIKAEQEERKRQEEEKKQRIAAFREKASFFGQTA